MGDSSLARTDCRDPIGHIFNTGLRGIRVYERLARRHDELGLVHALTKELEQRDSSEAVSSAGLERVVDTLKPAAAVILTPSGDPVTYFESESETIAVILVGKRRCGTTARLVPDGGVCACAPKILGENWGRARSYRLVIADGVRGMMIVRPRKGARTEISETDHGMLEAIAAQLSSAMTRIEALARLTREIEEKRALVRSKDQLIASVSHELRTPLTGIIGFAELLKEGGDTLGEAELEHAKQYIVTEAHDLGNIVEDLLTAARADLGALEVQVQACFYKYRD